MLLSLSIDHPDTTKKYTLLKILCGAQPIIYIYCYWYR